MAYSRSVQETKVLVVGGGEIGRQRAAAAKSLSGVELIGFVELDPQRAALVRRLFNVPAFESIEQAQREVRATHLLICTPPSTHFPLFLQAIHSGCHVLCEKPLAISPDDAREMVRVARDLGLQLGTGFNHRFLAPIRELVTLVRKGAIGPLRGVRALIGHRATHEFASRWNCDVEISGGGTLIDNGSHAADLVFQLMGVCDVTGAAVRHEKDWPANCEIEAFVLAQNAQGSVAELCSSWVLERGYLTIEARGAAGWLKADTAQWSLHGVRAGGRSFQKVFMLERLRNLACRHRFGCEASFRDELAEWLGLYEPGHRGWPSTASGDDGATVAEWVHTAYRSAATLAEAGTV